MEYVSTLSRLILSEREEAASVLSEIDGQIIDRLNFILHTLVECFGAKIETWYFDNAEEGQMGDLRCDASEIYDIHIEYQGSVPSNTAITLKDGTVFDFRFNHSVPIRWLFENFEEEISAGRELYLTNLEAKKQKLRAAKESRDLKRQEIINKLTNEEKQLLNVK